MVTAQRKSLPAASGAHLHQLDSGGLLGAHPTGQLLWCYPRPVLTVAKEHLESMKAMLGLSRDRCRPLERAGPSAACRTNVVQAAGWQAVGWHAATRALQQPVSGLLKTWTGVVTTLSYAHMI